MGSDFIATVRRFDRTVTQRVGALDDQYVSRDRPLAQAAASTTGSTRR